MAMGGAAVLREELAGEPPGTRFAAATVAGSFRAASYACSGGSSAYSRACPPRRAGASHAHTSAHALAWGRRRFDASLLAARVSVALRLANRLATPAHPSPS